MNDYSLALVISFFVLAVFIGGFWVGVYWQTGRKQ
tara:strand:+ start:218 stop:322 length:105 start_codon:yes stop_codon:yes gene_type:complete